MSDNTLPAEKPSEGQRSDNDGAGAKQQPPEPISPAVNRIEPQPDNSHPKQPKEEKAENEKAALVSEVHGLKRTDIWQAVFSGILVVCTGVQIYFVKQANDVATRAATAAEAAVVSAEKSYKLSESGSATADAAAAATVKTADAAKATADAATASVELAKQSNDASAQANRIAAEVSRASQKAADAAAATATSTQRSAQWLAFSSEKQLRAYLSVEGASLTFDRTRRMARAVIALRNTGNTFAKKVRPNVLIYCHPKGGVGAPGVANPSAPSIGPNGTFQILLQKSWEGDLEQMEFWIEGIVTYTDEFAKPRFTSFKFVAGDPIPGMNGRYSMMYAPDGNDAD